MTDPQSEADSRAAADAVGFWWHSMDLGHGIRTEGHKSVDLLERELASLRLSDLRGKSVLDIGAWDGYYSFEAERSGAARVVALDYFSWSLDLPGQIAYWRTCKARGESPLPYEETPYWNPARLPGKRGFDTAHAALRSRVETVVGDFTTMDLTTLGTFDVVFFLGVLYHIENPLATLKRLATVTRQLAIIETHGIELPEYEHLELVEFYSGSQLNADSTNWWGPNRKALEGMGRAAGFSDVDVVSPPAGEADATSPFRRARGAAGSVLRQLGLRRPRPPRHLRLVAHARK